MLPLNTNIIIPVSDARLLYSSEEAINEFFYEMFDSNTFIELKDWGNVSLGSWIVMTRHCACYPLILRICNQRQFNKLKIASSAQYDALSYLYNRGVETFKDKEWRRVLAGGDNYKVIWTVDPHNSRNLTRRVECQNTNTRKI